MSAPRVAAAPLTISDRTCEAVLGVPWRALRAFLREKGIAYQRIGRRPVVRADVVLAALGGEPVTTTAAPDWNESDFIERAARRRPR